MTASSVIGGAEERIPGLREPVRGVRLDDLADDQLVGSALRDHLLRRMRHEAPAGAEVVVDAAAVAVAIRLVGVGDRVPDLTGGRLHVDGVDLRGHRILARRRHAASLRSRCHLRYRRYGGRELIAAALGYEAAWPVTPARVTPGDRSTEMAPSCRHDGIRHRAAPPRSAGHPRQGRRPGRGRRGASSPSRRRTTTSRCGRSARACGAERSRRWSDAIAERQIVRTWLMRGTIHFAAARGRALAARVCAGRVSPSAEARRREQLGLDARARSTAAPRCCGRSSPATGG